MRRGRPNRISEAIWPTLSCAPKPLACPLRSVRFKGIVQGIGWGVVDQDRVNIPRSVPYVERSLNWVRVAQRFPVRIRLEKPPQELMRLGASAVVEIKHGAACR